jgi:site-specific DNA recombinase
MPPRRSRRAQQTGPLRVALYARQSLDRTGEGLGVERQLQKCREMCAEKGWEVSEDRTFWDNDISATTGKRRPGFEALLASSPDAIVVWHLDRLLRKGKDLERVIDLEVDVHTVTSAGPMDLSSPTGRMHARMGTVIATYEGELKAERMFLESQTRVTAGKPWWSSRPFGFEMDTTHRADEAAALARVYDDLLTGASLPALARQLNEAGFTTCRGNQWTATTLRPVLLNARNAAIRVYDGEEVGPAAWEPIVPEQTWRAAVRLLTNPARRTGGGGAAPRHLLTGVATCGACGSSMKIGWRGGRKGEPGAYSVYVCRASSCVSTPSVWADAGVVTQLIGELERPESRQEWQALRQQTSEATKALRAEEAAIRLSLDGAAHDHYVARVLSRETYMATVTDLNAQLADVEARLAEANEAADLATARKKDDKWTVLMTSYLAMDPETRDADKAPINVDELRTLISRVYERVELMPRGRGNAVLSPDHLRLTPRHAPTVAPVA